MRWNKPKSGDTKIKRKFALLPITIGKETRWMEWVTVRYEFSDWNLYRDPVMRKIYRRYGWFECEFIDEPN